MTPQEFCFWIQGFAEMSEVFAPNANQWKIIKDHL